MKFRMNFVVGDTVTPLPELFNISKMARDFLKPHQVYTIIETGRGTHPWFIAESNPLRWIDSPDWWKLASKSNPFTLDEMP